MQSEDKARETSLSVEDLKAKTLNLNISKPLDIDYAIKQLDGNKILYIKMLYRFEVLIIRKQMSELKEAIDSAYWQKVS